MLLYSIYLLQSPYSRLIHHYINNSSMHYLTILSPLLKGNQWSHIHDAMNCYYTISLYTYLHLFISRFYECIMMIISLITSILQKHLNYCRAITDSPKYHLTSKNISLHAISVLMLNLLDIWSMMNSSHCRFHQIPGKDLNYDYIIDLSLFNGFDALLVFVDRFTKMLHLIPCNKIINVPQFACMFLDHIIHLYEFPDSLISDHDSIFTSHFWKYLFKLLDINHRLSIFFHPQMNDQTEHMNQIIEQYLHIYYNYQ